jgi:RNA polymerase sigma-70 factor (ECF subfamily)
VKDTNTVFASDTPNQECILIANAKIGDRNAYGELVRMHKKGVIGIVYRMFGDIELAEDVAQEAFIKGWLNLHQYKPKSPFRNWIYRIAINTTIDMLRHQKPTTNVDSIQLASNIGDPEVGTVKKEETITVQNAVLSLSSASRAVVILREFEGLSYREISDALHIPMGTVMSRLNYARKQLRKILAIHLEVP